jgi:hypothetical protein
MSFNPRVLHFGRLELVEVYEFYDRPLLVCCRNTVGALYLAVLIDEQDDSTETWLYIALSEDRLRQVRSGGIDLHDAFGAAEDGIAFEVTIPSDKSTPVTVSPIPASDLTDEMLPLSGRFLNLPTATLPQLPASLADEAHRSHRDLLRLNFKLPAIFRSEAPARFVGQVLTSLQEAVSAISQSQEEGAVGRRGSLRRHTHTANELAVVAFGSGSFEIELASAGPANLFGVTEVTEPLREFVALLSLGSQAEPLQRRLALLPARAAANYVKFLKSLDDKIEYAKAEWASPNLDAGSETVTISAVTVHAAISALEYQAFESREEFDAVGRLVGASLDRMTFELRYGPRKREVFVGDISEVAVRSVEGAVIGDRYRAILERTQTVKMATGEVIEALTLLALKDPDATSDNPDSRNSQY